MLSWKKVTEESYFIWGQPRPLLAIVFEFHRSFQTFPCWKRCSVDESVSSIFRQSSTAHPPSGHHSSRIHSSWLGYKVDSGIELAYRPVSQCKNFNRYTFSLFAKCLKKCRFLCVYWIQWINWITSRTVSKCRQFKFGYFSFYFPRKNFLGLS